MKCATSFVGALGRQGTVAIHWLKMQEPEGRAEDSWDLRSSAVQDGGQGKGLLPGGLAGWPGASLSRPQFSYL